jgi:hypothetical protein
VQEKGRPDIRKGIPFWKVPRLRSFVLQKETLDEDEYGTLVNTDNDRVKTEAVGENPVPMLRCPPKITYENPTFLQPLTT